MGSVFGGGSQKTTQTVNNQPWAPQQPYLFGGLNDAQSIYNQEASTPIYNGNFVAGPNGYQSAAENLAGQYAGPGGPGTIMPLIADTSAAHLMGTGGTYVNNAENIASNGIPAMNSGLFNTLYGYGTGANTTQGANPTLSSALDNAAVNGANALNGFTNNLGTISNTALSDPTARIGNDAAAYANNPGVKAAIDSTNAQLQQVLNEQTIPGLNRAEAASGNLNSSRAGMQEGMAREGEGIAQGNADASILNNAYNTGMGTAAGLYSSGLNTANNANTSGLFDVGMNANNAANREQGLNEFNTTNQINAANSGLSQTLQQELGNANTQLAANRELGQGLTTGFNGATLGGNLAAGDYGLLANAGGLQQQGEQTDLTNALDQYMLNQSVPWNNLMNYWNIAGRPLGNTTTSTGTVQNSGPGVAGGLLGLGLGAAGLFGSGGVFPGVGNYIGGLFGSPAASGAVGGNYPL